MNVRFCIWSCVLIINLIVLELSIRLLALQEVPFSQSLVWRGLSCLLLVLLYARWQRLTLLPKSISKQIYRALIAGLALTLFTFSYHWLTAATVAVLSNIDAPLLIILGPLIGIKAIWRTQILSMLSIVFLMWYVLSLELQPQLFYGLSVLLAACFLLCFGYFFIQKSMQDENRAITILVPALAIIFYGLLQEVGGSSFLFRWPLGLFLIDFISGISMFVAYFAAMTIYTMTDLANAKFPTLLAALIIQPFEAWLLKTPLQINYLLATIGFVFTTYCILKWQNKLTCQAK